MLPSVHSINTCKVFITSNYIRKTLWEYKDKCNIG